MAVALDGESWSVLQKCEVQVGTADQTHTLIELSRTGNGIVGWDLDAKQVANGLGCEKVEGLLVRQPWWRR